MNKYSTYKEIDFLTDDYFVQYMLNPKSEDIAFWQNLIENKMVNENEFLSAYMTFKELHGYGPVVPMEKVNLVWDKIYRSKKHFKIKRFFFQFVATITLLLLSMLLPYYFLKNNKNNNFTSVSIESDTILIAEVGSSIQLVTNLGTINLEGEEASFEYDKDNTLKVNNEIVQAKISEKSIQYAYLTVPYGKRAFLRLSDGTSLWVNSGSKIKFPDKFADNKREIFVEGEIYADVIKDKNRPFIVTTDKLSMRVLGTVFNLSAYKDEEVFKVVLVNGNVSVESKEGDLIALQPNHLYTYSNGISNLKAVNVEEYISWKDGRLIFYNEPIENILLRLSRYYNVTMILPNDSSGITCSGKLELKDDIKVILNGLMEITPLSYASKENEYIVRFD